MITIEDVLDLMPIVSDRGWAVKANGALVDSDSRCALCSLANEIDPDFKFFQNFESAAKTLGIPQLMAETIVAANDRGDRAFSRDLEKALGVVLSRSNPRRPGPRKFGPRGPWCF